MAEAHNGKHEDIMMLDLGKLSKKKIKRLRKGKESAMSRLTAAIDEFKKEGAIEPNAQVVVAVVRQKRKSKSFLGL